ncbi:protein N-terminal glutamine amidohydrolase isoform 3-T3 [Spinachia spinachia]
MEREDRITPSRGDCVYTSCYCEENVWKLCEFFRSERTAPLQELFVVFISNENRKVPLWKQRSGCGEQPVIWDYHVVLLQVRRHSSALVYDLDTELSFPCSLKVYAAQALRSDRTIQPAYHRMLRVISADCFMLNFASDRSHMKKSDGSWGMPPPLYPPIQTTGPRVSDEPRRLHKYETCCWLGGGLQSGSVPAATHVGVFISTSFIIDV